MKQNGRITIVDSLRGFALLLIVLIHYVEHFDFFYAPEVNFLFSQATDSKVMELVFFFISGKAYSIFALLFGFSFFIQMNRKEKEGTDFRLKFLWRLTVLLIMGFVHSLIYKGDILHIYAMLGAVLVLFYRVNTKALLLMAVLLALQIPLITTFIYSFIEPGFEYTQSFGSGYWQEGNNIYAQGSLGDVVSYNIWKGRANVWGWTFYNGRYIQLIALFIIGFIMGREKIFEELYSHKKNTIKVLLISLLCMAVFYFIEISIWNFSLTGSQQTIFSTVIKSYYNLAFTSVILSAIILIYLKFKDGSIFNSFAAYGRMSLSNYVFQALFGVIFFYGFGLAMYKYMGSTWSLIFGFIVFVTQVIISKCWAKNFYYGPLEWLWRALTFFNFKIKFRKT
ncbi:MAG: DUF418 domain-containing protein [Ignavibacteria bacterium]